MQEFSIDENLSSGDSVPVCKYFDVIYKCTLPEPVGPTIDRVSPGLICILSNASLVPLRLCHGSTVSPLWFPLSS